MTTKVPSVEELWDKARALTVDANACCVLVDERLSFQNTVKSLVSRRRAIEEIDAEAGQRSPLFEAETENEERKLNDFNRAIAITEIQDGLRQVGDQLLPDLKISGFTDHREAVDEVASLLAKELRKLVEKDYGYTNRNKTENPCTVARFFLLEGRIKRSLKGEPNPS